MDRRLRAMAVAGALLLAAAPPARALDLTWGDVQVLRLGSYGFTATNGVLSFDGGATDQLYQMFGYVGNESSVVPVDGGSFDVQGAISAVGNVASSSLILDDAGAAALGLAPGELAIDYAFTLVDDTSAWDADGLLWDITVRNLSTSALSLGFYSYLDLDLDGAADFADDVVDANVSRMIVGDADSATSFTWKASNGGTADRFQVGTYPGVRSFLDGLAATGRQDLSDASASFGPADFTGAYQYDLLIPAGGSVSLGSGSVAVPEPSSSALTLLGLTGLAVLGRRARRR